MEQTTSSSPGVFSTYTGNDALTNVAANGICDLRRDVAKSESDIKTAILQQSLSNSQEFCAVNKSVHDAECNIVKNAADISQRDSIALAAIERDLQNRLHETRQVLTSLIGDKTERIIDRFDRDTVDLKNQMRIFEMSASEKFCDIKSQVKDSERRILDQLSANKLDEKNEIIDSLRQERTNDKFAYQFGLQNQDISYLKQMINSVDQNQKFSSKVTQFGTGNLATPTQTANQG